MAEPPSAVMVAPKVAEIFVMDVTVGVIKVGTETVTGGTTSPATIIGVPG